MYNEIPPGIAEGNPMIAVNDTAQFTAWPQEAHADLGLVDSGEAGL